MGSTTIRVRGREPTAEPEPEPLLELLGKFQLANEQAIAGLRADLEKQVGKALEKLGKLADDTQQTKALMAALETANEGVGYRMAAAEREVVTALKHTVEQANIARQAAQVYEKIQEAQPDFHALVQKLRGELGKLKDRIVELESVTQDVRSKLEGMSVGLVEVQADTRAHATLLNPMRPVGPGAIASAVDQ